MAEIQPRTALVPRPAERLASVVLILLAALALSLASAASALAAKPRAASVTASAPKVSAVTDSSAKLRVSGTVKLPANLENTAKNRKKVRVAVTLRDAKRKTESFTAKIDAKRRYSVTKRTKLRGALKVGVRVEVAGKPSGKAVTKKVTVKVASKAPTGGPSAVGGAGGPSAPTGPTVLNGLLRLDPGTQSRSTGKYSGTYFRMGFPGGWEINHDSSTTDKSYTLLRPGTDGGLRTDRYQEPPFPAFDGLPDPVDPTITRGNALANRIVSPQRFFGVDFSIVTAAIDPQSGLADPLPVIVADGTRLSGQITAWAAQWNGASFNQGSPKPAGTPLPGSGADTATSALTGTYDPSTRRFSLDWTSLIIGGPFGGHHGVWHLEGTFEPAG